jgi:hypothetical protein
VQARDHRGFVRELLQQPVLRCATSGGGYGAANRTGTACQTSEVAEVSEVSEIAAITAVTATCAIAAALSALHRAVQQVRHPKKTFATISARFGRAAMSELSPLLIPAPDAPWLECFILDISDSGICIEVGALAIPKVFGVSFNTDGTVIRVCFVAWRRGELIGASFITAKQLRQREKRKDYVDPRLQKA